MSKKDAPILEGPRPATASSPATPSRPKVAQSAPAAIKGGVLIMTEQDKINRVNAMLQAASALSAWPEVGAVMADFRAIRGSRLEGNDIVAMEVLTHLSQCQALIRDSLRRAQEQAKAEAQAAPAPAPEDTQDG